MCHVVVHAGALRWSIRNQVINYSHLFPTRYALELESLKGSVSQETFKEPSQREDAKKLIKKQLEERYQGGKNKWFFQPLRVRAPLLAAASTTHLSASTLSSRHGSFSFRVLRMPSQNSSPVHIPLGTATRRIGHDDPMLPRSPPALHAHLPLHLVDLAQSEHSLNNNTPGLVRVSVVAHNLAGEHERGDKEPVARRAGGGREARLEALQ